MTGEDDDFSEQETSEDVEEIEEEVVEDPAEAIFENGKGYVGSEDADRISQQGFYGNRI